jgi:hypothetical protein
MPAAIQEAGWVSWFAVAATVAGLTSLVSVGRRGGRAGSIAASWSAVVVAVALLNASAGQRKVDDAVQRESVSAHQIAMLSQGTREASANLFVGGTCVVLLMAVGGVFTLVQRPTRTRA